MLVSFDVEADKASTGCFLLLFAVNISSTLQLVASL